VIDVDVGQNRGINHSDGMAAGWIALQSNILTGYTLLVMSYWKTGKKEQRREAADP